MGAMHLALNVQQVVLMFLCVFYTVYWLLGMGGAVRCLLLARVCSMVLAHGKTDITAWLHAMPRCIACFVPCLALPCLALQLCI